MKIADIREMSIEDLKANIAEAKADYAKLKINHKVSLLEDPLKIRKSRKHIARLETVLNQKLAQQ
ncbi:MAG: 50S ribosomal protein L29 [Weeksellaceae bacterium]|jgi:large subunit ribosomal protein L29|nr:50S ribosomal protein L29 [Weeksellaceae bacterium]MDX9704944.1 50S ribosomal protein L29 [Weeksellaceae bacterium]